MIFWQRPRGLFKWKASDNSVKMSKKKFFGTWFILELSPDVQSHDIPSYLLRDVINFLELKSRRVSRYYVNRPK